MKRYESVEIEIKNIDVADIISTSPNDVGLDTPIIGASYDILG